MQEIEFLLDLDIKDTALTSYDKTENSYIRFLMLVLFKMAKMEQIEEDKKMSYKQKFSKSFKLIKNLKVFLPEIEDSQQQEVEQSLTDLNEILSNFYAGDEFPFNAI